MFQYQSLLFEILREGEDRNDRTGVGTRAVFNKHMSFRMDGQKFPLITLKQTFYKGPLGELAAFIRGSSDNRDLKKYGCHYWEQNLEADYWKGSEHQEHENDLGELGYSRLLRDFSGVDQLRVVMEKAKNKPTDRRLLVSHWDPSKLSNACLPPCHYSWQIFIHGPDMDYVSLVWNQRSVDVMLGLPADFVYYGALLVAIAKELGKTPYEVSCNLGDTHIYHNHFDAALDLAINGNPYEAPTYVWNGKKDQQVEEFTPGDIQIVGYQHGPAIKLPMAV